MAEIITGGTTGFINNTTDQILSDVVNIRREGSEHTSEIIKEGLKDTWKVNDSVKDARFDVIDKVDGVEDKLGDQATQFYISGQAAATNNAAQVAAIKAATDLQFAATQAAIASGIDRAAAATALEGAKNAAAVALESARLGTAVALGQATLSKEIVQDGNETRRLINDLKTQDLNRMLIERNSELVEERGDSRRWRYEADRSQVQGQFAALSSQIQNFGSQLSDARNSMVNFGTQLGVGQRSTSNNVG